MHFWYVFQPITFTPRKDPTDASLYLRPVGVPNAKWDAQTAPAATLGDKVPVYIYTPQPELPLGLDLQGGMRVVMQIASRGEFDYAFTPSLPSDDASQAKYKSSLTDGVKAALGDKVAGYRNRVNAG